MKVEHYHLDEVNPNVTLTTYVLDGSPETLNGKPRPAIAR